MSDFRNTALMTDLICTYSEIEKKYCELHVLLQTKSFSSRQIVSIAKIDFKVSEYAKP